MKIFAATGGGIVGAAQVSTAFFTAHPKSATDIGLTGAGGASLLMLANWPRRRDSWREMRKAFWLALIS